MKRFKIIRMFLLAIILLPACENNPEFPDPKFDSNATRNIEVRRDTADLVRLGCWMDVPNGIDYIEVLNGQSYQLIEKLEQYRGAEQLEFTYPIDISDIVKDTTLAYIVKVYDLKMRTYNKAFVVQVKRFSAPEINLVSGVNTSVLMDVAPVQAEISTGLIPIRYVKVMLDGEEVFEYAPEEEVSEYFLDYLLEDLYELKKYSVQIILEDREGRRSSKELFVFRIDKIEKPVKILCGGYLKGEITLTYDYEDRLTSMEFINETISCKVNFTYDWGGFVINIEQTNGGLQQDYINYKIETPFNGLITKVTETWGHGGMGGNIIMEADIFGGSYIAAATTPWKLKYFVSGAARIENIAYEEAFNKVIWAESWETALPSVHNGNRARMVEFKPIPIPTYLSGLVYPCLRINRFEELFEDLFFTEYVHMKTVSYLDSEEVLYYFSYSMDDKGRLSEWRRVYNMAGERSDYYQFIYADTEVNE